MRRPGSAILSLLRARQERGRGKLRDLAKRAGAVNRARAQSCRTTNPRQTTVATVLHQPLIETEFFLLTLDPRKLPTRQRFVDLILSYFQIPSSAYSRIPYESGWLPAYRLTRRGPRACSSYSAVSHTSRKVRRLHRSGQPWMGPSIVPKLAVAPVFTAFTVRAVIMQLNAIA